MAVVALLAACGQPPAATPAERAVRVDVQGCGVAPATFGSGVVIGHDRVLTVAHTVARGTAPSVTDHTGAVYPARVLAFDVANDLAMLDVPGLGHPQPPFILADETTSGHVFGAASPGPVPHRVVRPAQVTIEEVLGTDRHARLGYELDATTSRGDSGAGVYDAEERLIGIVFAVSTNRSSTWVTASPVIETFLASIAVDGPSFTCDEDRSWLTVASP